MSYESVQKGKWHTEGLTLCVESVGENISMLLLKHILE